MTTIKAIANAELLTYVETTSAWNGYPEAVQGAIIGFDSFKQAEEVAKQYGLKIISLEKLDGWALWHRKGEIFDALQRSSDDYGSDYNQFCHQDTKFFYENEIKHCLGDFDNLDDLCTFIEKRKMVFEELEKIEENELVITYCGNYYDTIKKETMAYSFDTHNYAIGVVE